MTGEQTAIARMLRERAQGELWIAARGDSMSPRLSDGVQLLVRPSDRPPRIGEVWLFVTDSGDVTAHRFLCSRRGQLVFFGDSERRADRPVHSDGLVGRVVEVDETGVRTNVTARAPWPVVRIVARTVGRRLRPLYSRRDVKR